MKNIGNDPCSLFNGNHFSSYRIRQLPSSLVQGELTTIPPTHTDNTKKGYCLAAHKSQHKLGSLPDLAHSGEKYLSSHLRLHTVEF